MTTHEIFPKFPGKWNRDPPHLYSQRKAKQYNATWPHWKTHKFQEVPIKVRSNGGDEPKIEIFSLEFHPVLFFFRPLKSHFFSIQLFTLIGNFKGWQYGTKEECFFCYRIMENWVLLLLTFDVYLFWVPQCQIDHLLLHTKCFLCQKILTNFQENVQETDF